jgi:hypothetical protein
MPFDFVTVGDVHRAQKGYPRAAQGRENWVERHAKLDVFFLHRAGMLLANRVTVAIGGQQQTILIEQEAWRRDQRLRPNFLCPTCGRRCRRLHEKDGVLICRKCAQYDYASRHLNRFDPAFNRVMRLKKILAANPRHRDAKRIRAEIRSCERALAKNLKRVLAALAKHLKDDGP